jgi:glyoxalase-like protein
MPGSVLTRRELLSLCGTTGASMLIGSVMSSGESLIPAERAVDHLLLGAAGLENAMAWFERKTGVKAEAGGSHPGIGTRNALISLGGRQYLEIIAPDPRQTAFNFQIDVRKLTEPRLITWAAATTDIDAIAQKARAAGHQIFGPRDGSRARPDGRVLHWKTLGVLNKFGLDGVEPIPFFIQWASGSLHPAEDSPKGCELQSFEIGHPEPANVIAALKGLGIQARVTRSTNVTLTAAFKTPKGRVELK